MDTFNHTTDHLTKAEVFDYSTEAELFSARGKNFRRQGLGYRRFAHAAEAIRFAMEEMSPQFFAGTFLEVHEIRYRSNDIRRLYESAAYPLVRCATASIR